MDLDEAIAFGKAFCVVPPTPEEWMARRDTFTGFGIKYFASRGNAGPPEKFRVLERELERCYCSGAHLACIVLAAAIIEALKIDVNNSARAELSAKLDYIDRDIERLREMRNEIMHHGKPTVVMKELTLEKYAAPESDHEVLAREACAMVYHVARAFVGLDPETAFKGKRRGNKDARD